MPRSWCLKAVLVSFFALTIPFAFATFAPGLIVSINSQNNEATIRGTAFHPVDGPLTQKKRVPPPPNPNDVPLKAAPAPAGHGGSSSFAIIDIRQAILGSEEGKQRLGALQKESEPKQAELKSKNDALQAMKESHANTSEIDAKQRDFDAEVTAAQEQFWKKQQAIFQEITKKMAPAITQYASDHGYGAVLDSSSPWPQSPLMWFAAPADITKSVLDVYEGRASSSTSGGTGTQQFAIVNVQHMVGSTNEGRDRLAAANASPSGQFDAQNTIYQEVLQKIAPGTVKFASDHGITALLDADKQWPDSNVVWFDPSLDISSAVASAYDHPEQPAPAVNHTKNRFAVINIQSAVTLSAEGHTRMDTLIAEFKPMQDELNSRNAELQRMKNSHGKPAEIETKQRDFDIAAKAAQDQFQEKQKVIFQDVLTRMAPMIMKYASDHNLGLVLDSSQAWPQSNLLYHDPAADITKEIDDAYDAAYPPPCVSLDTVQIKDDMPSGAGHCAGELDFWFTNTSTQAIDCAIIFHKSGRFNPASLVTFSIPGGEKVGGPGKISTCGADSGEMQYQCFSHAANGELNRCITRIKW